MILPGSLILIIWGELSVEIDCKCNSVHIALCPDPFSHDENSLVIIEFLPHLFPHKRVRSGDHWVLTTPISSRSREGEVWWSLTTPISSQEGEVWWSLSSYHTYFLTITRGWGLVIIEFLPHPFPHERVGFVHETSVHMYYVEWFVHSLSPPRIRYMKFTTMGIFTGKLSLT